MATPKVTFVIPTHNRCAQLLKNLSLLRASVGRLPHEVLVVANDCSDETADKVVQRFPAFRVIELNSRHNAAARNVALSAASADFVFMLDDLTWPDNGATEYALRMMADQPRLAAAVGRLRRLGEPLRPESLSSTGLLTSSGTMLRRRAAIEVGGYPIDFDDLLADCDLSARLWQAGWQIRHFDAIPAWREPGHASPAVAQALEAASPATRRFWSRYAPAALYEPLVGEPASRCRVRRRPLTEQTVSTLLGRNLRQSQAPAA